MQNIKIPNMQNIKILNFECLELTLIVQVLLYKAGGSHSIYPSWLIKRLHLNVTSKTPSLLKFQKFSFFMKLDKIFKLWVY